MRCGADDLIQEALEYASKYHLPVFPLNGKKPLTEHGCKDATTDQNQIKAWWNRFPSANVGIACGRVIVIDVDQNESKGKYGMESLHDLERELGELPDTWRCLTGGGGVHFYFECPEGVEIRNSTSSIADYIDIRGVGGYVVAPPSTHPETGRRYEWELEPEEIDLAMLPDAWLKAIQGANKAGEDSKYTEPETVPEGQRNHEIFKFGASLRARNISAIKTYQQMQDFNSKKCIPPVDDKELDTIYDSVMRYAQGTPQAEIIEQEQEPVRPVILKSFSEIEEKRADWLISGLIPKGQITTMAGDGGVGKTSLWCSIVAAVSSGNNCFLDIPFWERSPGKVIIFSGEDSAEYVLKRRLRKHGADLNNVFTVAISDDNFEQIKFGSPLLEGIIEQEKPDLVVFDPIQSFVDPKIKMGDRNAMRQSLIPVAGWGEKYGTTFLIILHSNKQSSVWGRKRMADSSDVWDMSRSVLMVGSTQGDGVNYCSQEKSNYGKLSETHLFSIEDEVVTDKGTTVKRDRDFVLEQLHEQKRQAPARDSARDVILEFLADGQPKFTKELDEYIMAMSISKTSLRRAKEELREEGLIKYIPGGGRSRGGWRVQKVNK